MPPEAVHHAMRKLRAALMLHRGAWSNSESDHVQEAGLRSGLLLIPDERRVYGASWLIRVAQFPRDVRVPPQEPIAPVRYCANVQV